MSKNIVSAFVVAALLTLWLGSGLYAGDSRATPQAQAPGAMHHPAESDRPQLSKVRVAQTSAQPRTRTVVLRGRTESKRTVEVTAELAGQVISRPVERGTRVSRGQLLCEIAVDDRKVAVEEARAGYEEARLEHAGNLKLVGQGLLSEVAIASSEARREAARAHLHRQELNLARTQVTAPFDGVIEQLHLDAGDYAMPGASCATLIDLDPMLVVAHVTEEEVENLQAGIAVTGSVRSGRRIEGRLTFIGKQSDPVTRTYPVEITVDNSDYSLRSGLTANVNVGLGQVDAHRVSPSLLTLGDDGNLGIRTLDNTNRVVFNEVQIVEDGPQGLWVTGLQGTVNLITVGQEYVSAGQQVEPVFIAPPHDQFAAR